MGTETKKSMLNCSYLDEISVQGLFIKSKIPAYQKSVANNFVTIKKFFLYTVAQPKITRVEASKLAKIGFLPLEETEGKKIIKELLSLLEWANSGNFDLMKLAEDIFKIRVKELKFLCASVSPVKLYEFKNGYKILEKYLEFASS